MSPLRRTALTSVAAAGGLIAIKLFTAIQTSSLGLFAEAVHSGTDLVAAILTFFAVGYASRPADRGHPYGHRKAEHLTALAEGGILFLAGLFIATRSALDIIGRGEPTVKPETWAILVVVVVIAIDVARSLTSLRTSRRYGSEALRSNALHFASDLAGSIAVLFGLIGAQAGLKETDSAAGFFVAVLVLVAAGRLMRRNIDVLMDRTPAGAHDAATAAIAALPPSIRLRRLRVRHAGGRHFADVVIGVPPGVAVAQGHAAATLVEDALERALPGSDVVVHVEPDTESAGVSERAHEAATRVARVREIHNVSVIELDGATEVSLHLKLPGNLTLDEAHEIACEVEEAIVSAVPEVDTVQTHIEPLAEPGEGSQPDEGDVGADRGAVTRIVRERTGEGPRELRFLRTDEGLVAYLTLGLDPECPLADAHARASEIEEAIRSERPAITDVVVHTEP